MKSKRKTRVQVACNAFVLASALAGASCTSADGEQQTSTNDTKHAGAPAATGGDKNAQNETESRAGHSTVDERESESAQGSEGCDALKLDPPAEGEGIQLSVELALEPGKERQICSLARLDHAININWSHGVYTRGSHHAFVSQTSYHGDFPHTNIEGETVDDPTIARDCVSANSDWDTKGVIAYGRPVGSENRVGKGLLPEDVAIKVAAGDIVQLNFHMINVMDKPIKACYKQNFYGIPDEQVRAEAGTIFWYNNFVTVPANSSSSATMACPITEDVTVADQVSHMHKRGVGYTATLLDGDPIQGGKEMQTLYEGTTWDEPTERINTPALQLKKGQWITFTCDYENTEDRNIAQGQWTSDEMCMFIGTYWPRSKEMDSCASDGHLIGRNFGTGDKSASELAQCWTSSPKQLKGGGPSTNEDRYQSQRCITESCPNASARFGELASGKVDPSSIACN